MKISALITAYKAQDFIELCLNSFKQQTFLNNPNNEIEVLLAIDGCKRTLNKVNEIKHKYPFLKVYLAKYNVGTYVLRNSLAQLAKYPNLFFFDSDDLLLPDMLNIVTPHIKEANILRYKFMAGKLRAGAVIVGNSRDMYPHGTMILKKSLFERLYGFQNWYCAADTEFLMRSVKLGIEHTLLEDKVYIRLFHNKSLTQRRDTGMQSAYRKKVHSNIDTKTDWDVPFEPVTTDLQLIE